MTRAAKDVEKSESSYRVTGAGGMRCVAAVDRPVVHQGAKHEVPVWPGSVTPRLCAWEKWTHVSARNLCMCIQRVMFHGLLKMEATKCPSTYDRRAMSTSSIQSGPSTQGVLVTLRRRFGLMLQHEQTLRTWFSVREARHRRTQSLVWLTGPWRSQIHRDREKMVGPGAGEGGGESVLHGAEFWWEWLQTTWTCLVPPSCTLENG